MATDYRGEPWTLSTDTLIGFQSGIDAENGETITSAEIMDAYDLYKNPEEVDVNIFIDSGKATTVKNYIYQLAESRKDAMAIIDPPYATCVNNTGNEAVDLRNWRKGLADYAIDNFNVNTSYAALYGNWLEVYDRYNAKYRWIPASGHIAGLFANTDDLRDPW